MLVLWEAINLRHSTTTHFTRGADQKFQRTEEEEARVGGELEVKTYEQPLTMVSSFRYLGRNLVATENYWMEAIVNLRKKIWTWARLSHILGREGAEARTMGRL